MSNEAPTLQESFEDEYAEIMALIPKAEEDLEICRVRRGIDPLEIIMDFLNGVESEQRSNIGVQAIIDALRPKIISTLQARISTTSTASKEQKHEAMMFLSSAAVFDLALAQEVKGPIGDAISTDLSSRALRDARANTGTLIVNYALMGAAHDALIREITDYCKRHLDQELKIEGKRRFEPDEITVEYLCYALHDILTEQPQLKAEIIDFLTKKRDDIQDFDANTASYLTQALKEIVENTAVLTATPDND